MFHMTLNIISQLFKNDNTRIYNLISVPRITLFLLGEAIISSKTDTHNGSKKEKRSYSKVKNNKTMLKI